MSARALVLAIVVGLTALVAACSAAAELGTAEKPRTVRLDMTEDLRFEPSQLEVRQGETIRFEVRNLDRVRHEIYIGTEVEQVEHAGAHAAVPPEEEVRVPHFGYGVHVAPFGTGILDYRFDLATEIIIGCHIAGHYDAGMKAVVTVLP